MGKHVHNLTRRAIGAVGAVALAATLTGLSIAPAGAQGTTIPIDVDAFVVGGPSSLANVTIALDGPGASIASPGTTGIHGVQVNPGDTYSLTSTISGSDYSSQWVCRDGAVVANGSITIPGGLTAVECSVYHAYSSPKPISVSLSVVNDGAGTKTSGDFDLELFTGTGGFVSSGMASGGAWNTTGSNGSYQIGISGLGDYAVTAASCTANQNTASADEALSGTQFSIDDSTTSVDCALTVDDTAELAPTPVPATPVPTPQPTAVPPTAVPPTPIASTPIPSTPIASTPIPATAVPATATPDNSVANAGVANSNSGASNNAATANAAAASSGDSNLSSESAPVTLAFTGAETTWLAIAGTALLAVGAGLTGFTRRRHA